VAPWGSAALVAFSTVSGSIKLIAFEAQTQSVAPVAPSSSDSDWNNIVGTTALPGSFPRLAVYDDQVALTWQRQDGAQWRMAVRTAR
jgi:hypothetical protein